MVDYIKHHFFVRYRTFESWTHLNQLAEQWLRDEADHRCHGTVQEIVAERFTRKASMTRPIGMLQVSWDAYIEIRGRRYSVPAHLASQTV